MTAERTRARRRLPVRVAAALAAAVAVTAAAALTLTSAGAQPQASQEWDLVWADEFDGPAGQLPSADNWRFDIGHSYPGGPANWGTGEIAYHTDDPANISLDGDGHLNITALRDGSGNWTSARIETERANFRAPEGGSMRIEGSLRLPQVTGEAALGYWPAFWALGSPYRGNYWNWPGIGEYDIMENVNGEGTVHGVLHCGTAPGGPCNEFNGLGAATTCGGSCHSGFHTYAFEWDDSGSTGELRWYADGQLFHTVRESDLPADTWADMTEHAGYFILLNLAVGGAFPDGVSGITTPTGATEPGHSLLVDYVRVYTSGGSPDPDPTTTEPDEPGDGHDAYSPSTRPRSTTPRVPPSPDRPSAHSAMAPGCASTTSTSDRAARSTSSPRSPPAPPAASAAWSRSGSTRPPPTRSGRSRSRTPADGSPGGTCPATSPPPPASTTSTSPSPPVSPTRTCRSTSSISADRAFLQ
ncbi:hypothetical protein GCM10029992_45930 [Glycomyces albus]